MLKYILVAIILYSLVCELWWLTFAAWIVLNYIDKQQHYEETQRLRRLIEELVDKK